MGLVGQAAQVTAIDRDRLRAIEAGDATPTDAERARLEALAALGGMDRDALHSQLAAAVRAIVHVSRGPAGRRVSEIALLRRDGAGRCGAVPVWRAGEGIADASEFQRLVAAGSPE